jgi:hypothetical protein
MRLAPGTRRATALRRDHRGRHTGRSRTLHVQRQRAPQHFEGSLSSPPAHLCGQVVASKTVWLKMPSRVVPAGQRSSLLSYTPLVRFGVHVPFQAVRISGPHFSTTSVERSSLDMVAVTIQPRIIPIQEIPGLQTPN